MKSGLLLAVGVLTLGTPACDRGGPAKGVAAAKAFDAAVEPTPREILRALLSIRDMPLSADSSCATAGTSPDDMDLGDYVSGWLAELKEGPGKNWIETSAGSNQNPGTGVAAWQSAVVFRHVDGDDRWGWGVSFLLDATHHQVIPGSVRCTGAG
jgi:hypothetical protein